jgi:hypothetical protein
VTSLLGPIKYPRAYYHCDHCLHGWFPTDEELGLTERSTLGAREVISLAGVEDAFAVSAERVLKRLSGISVSASTVQRVTETVGSDLAEHRERGDDITPDESWDWSVDAVGQRVAYVSLDATGVPQQGPHAERADGRMAWVASVFSPAPRDAPVKRRLRRVRYVSGLMSLDQIGRQLRRECQQVGISRADVVIGVTDGGQGLEDCLVETALAGLARQVVTILDFYHCAEHVSEFLALWCDPAQVETEGTNWRHRLKHEGGAAVLAELEALDLNGRPETARDSHRKLCGYLRSNLHRTDYPTYLAADWEIGSGEIESACKTIVGQRLKGPGMRWRERGTTAVCQLRALFKSDRNLWTNYWHPANSA